MNTNSGASLRVRVSADLADIKQGLGLLRGELSKLKSEAAKSVDIAGLQQNFTTLKRTVAGLFAGISVGSIFQGIISETRDATDEVAQLRAVVESTGKAAGYSAGELQKMAAAMAASTTHSEGEIIRAQTRLLSYTGIVGEQFPRALQMAIDQSARLGEDIQQSAETIGKALDKPSQGVAALTKQGFKFTEQQKQQMKVLEQSGRTAEAQAIVLDAMAESYAGAAAAARGTFSGALKSAGNALRELLDGSGASGVNGATAAINQLADALRSPEIKQAFSDLAGSVLRAVAGFARFVAQDGVRYLRMLAEAAATTVKHVDLLAVAVGSYLAARGIVAAITGIQALIKWLAVMRTSLAASAVAARGLKATLATMGGPITLAVAALTTVLYELYQRTEQAKEAQEDHKRALKEVGDMSKYARDQAFEVAKAKREEALATLLAAKAQLQAARINARENIDAGRGGGNLLGLQSSSRASMNPALVKAEADAAQAQKMVDEWDEKMFEILTTGIDEMLKPLDVAATETGKAIAKSNALLIDAVRRTMAELDALYERNGISIADYFAKRTALQQRSIDLQIEQARSEKALASDAGARRKIDEQIVTLQRDRAEVATRAALDQKKAEEDLAKQLGEVRIRLLELDGETARVERAKLEGEYKDLFAKLRAESDEAGRAMVANLIDRLVAKSKQDELRAAVSRITSDLQGKESSISAQVSAGMLGRTEGERQINALRQQSIDKIKELRAEQQAYLDSLAPDSPEMRAAVQGLDQTDQALAEIIARQQEWRNSLEDLGVDSLSGFFEDLISGAKSFKDAFKDMVKSFVAGVAQMLARRLATRAVDSVMSMFPAKHAGGVAGAIRMFRNNVNPAVFAAAPRLHGGGVAGLQHDEIPTILKRGEVVRTQQQERALQARLDATTGAVRPVAVSQTFVVQGTPDRRTREQMAAQSGRAASRALKRGG